MTMPCPTLKLSRLNGRLVRNPSALLSIRKIAGQQNGENLSSKLNVWLPHQIAVESQTLFRKHNSMLMSKLCPWKLIARKCQAMKTVSSTAGCSVNEALSILSSMSTVSINLVNERRLDKVSKYDYVRYMSLTRYFTLIQSGKRKIQSSIDVASLFPGKSQQFQARKKFENGRSIFFGPVVYQNIGKASTSNQNH